MPSPDEIRSQVSESYAKAVTESRSCCGDRIPQGVAAKLAGYGEDELAAIPENAVVNSFGCGNPLAYAGVREGDVVLDLGSGAGIDLLLAARRVGPSGRVIGVDMTPEIIERARANAAAAGFANVEVRRGVIEELPVESNSVDWVISNCVINLSPEKDRVFAEIARVLKPGGRLAVSDLVVDGIPEALRENVAVYCACVGGAISEGDYLAGLERAGLEGVRAAARLDYDRSQVEALIASEVDGAACGCSSGLVEILTREASTLLEGRVASVRFEARKSGGATAG